MQSHSDDRVRSWVNFEPLTKTIEMVMKDAFPSCVKGLDVRDKSEGSMLNIEIEPTIVPQKKPGSSRVDESSTTTDLAGGGTSNSATAGASAASTNATDVKGCELDDYNLLDTPGVLDSTRVDFDCHYRVYQAYESVSVASAMVDPSKDATISSSTITPVMLQRKKKLWVVDMNLTGVDLDDLAFEFDCTKGSPKFVVRGTINHDPYPLELDFAEDAKSKHPNQSSFHKEFDLPGNALINTLTQTISRDRYVRFTVEINEYQQPTVSSIFLSFCIVIFIF